MLLADLIEESVYKCVYNRDQEDSLHIYYRQRNALKFNSVLTESYFQKLMTTQTHITFFISNSEKPPTENIHNEFNLTTSLPGAINQFFKATGQSEISRDNIKHCKTILQTYPQSLRDRKGKSAAYGSSESVTIDPFLRDKTKMPFI